MLRFCKHHGETEFRQQSSNGKVSYHCVMCYVQRQSRLRKEKKLRAIEYKGGCCSRCGYNKYPDALEFHHLDPSEKETGAEIRNLSWDRLRIEIDKCILVYSSVCELSPRDSCRIAR